MRARLEQHLARRRTAHVPVRRHARHLRRRQRREQMLAPRAGRHGQETNGCVAHCSRHHRRSVYARGTLMRTLTFGAAAVAILMLTGCVTSRQARDVKPGGFLGNSASLLVQGEKGEETLLVYHKPGTDWRSYQNVLLDPVAMWSDKPSTLPPEQLADYQKLVDNFQVALADKLARDYRMVDAPGPRALRIQTAIVNGAQANNTLKVAKVIAPYAGFADLLWTFATGKPAFTGEVSLEYMIRDSQTDELLAAGADRRVGGNQLGASTFTTWGDVKNILTYWSDLAIYRLCVDRAAADCRKPSAGLTEP
jgi:hypothetical protein